VNRGAGGNAPAEKKNYVNYLIPEGGTNYEKTIF